MSLLSSLSKVPIVAALAVVLVAADCAPGGSAGPTVSLGLNAIPADMSALLVVPPSGFVVNVTIAPGSAAAVPSTFRLFARHWGDDAVVNLTAAVTATPTGAVGVVPTSLGLASGTHTLVATVQDTAGATGEASLSFAVRPFGTSPPIGPATQFLWYDFAADRDAVPGPDFDVDLEAFGLGSPGAPELSSAVRAEVEAAVIERLMAVYYDANPNGLPQLDPVYAFFTAANPYAGEVTRVCVGGEDPSGGSTIGSILFDPGNANRTSVECGTLPPGGIFPRELLVYSGDPWFQSTFDALRPATGGVPVGASPLDAIVLAPGFDPQTAPPDQSARHALVTNAMTVFANALGSIIAHETGHALGLVPPGTPGAGLYGGASGPEYIHDVTPAGTAPPENFLMKAGNTFSFAKLAGLAGNALPFLRPIDHAYLRDRVVLDSRVTGLYMPPEIASVTPSQITGSVTPVTITGTDFRATPWAKCKSPQYTYYVIGETFVSPTQINATIVKSQIPAGTYDLELTNPDGQVSVLPGAIVVY